MSILDKLKDLVASMESMEDEDAPKAEPELELEPEPEPEPEKEESIEEPVDYLECTEEESGKVFDSILEVRKLKSALVELLIDFEEKKHKILSLIKDKKKETFSELNELKEKYSIPTEGYSVELPSSPEDKVAFKKD
tara:strand:- start:2817 stop:3227 length:411 start_codon:yes stop_codon:yes gene_type:complete